jgi:O-acetylserine/cysteine efflux transporter
MLAWISAIAIIPTGIIAASSGPLLPDPSLLEVKHWLAAFFALMISALMGQGVLFSLYRIYPISTVAPFTLLIPVFTALFAILIYGESLQARLLLGGAVVLAGVWIQINRFCFYSRPLCAKLNASWKTCRQFFFICCGWFHSLF